jgi:ornithine cyclodeaminase
VSESRILLLGQRDVENLLEFDAVMEVVREAYLALAEHQARLFPLVREPLDGAMFGLRSAYWSTRGLLGLKSSGYYPDNAQVGEPNHQATIVLVSPTSGKPRAIVDGNHVTLMRTAAAAALGSGLLARPDARRILVIGNGHQARAQLRSHHHVFAARAPQLSVFAPRDDDAATKGNSFAVRLAEDGLSVAVEHDLSTAVRGADVVVTATLARAPLFEAGLATPGTHVTAVGSDSPGKRELDEALIRAARVVVDDTVQSRRFGESQGLDDVEFVEIGDVLRSKSRGRRGPDEITVFDTTGIGLHDVVTAELAVQNALEAGVGTWISLA